MPDSRRPFAAGGGGRAAGSQGSGGGCGGERGSGNRSAGASAGTSRHASGSAPGRGASLGRIALLFGAPFLVRLVALLELRGEPLFRLLVVDARTYHETAVRLASGLAQAELPFWQPPLYPYFLALHYAIGGPNPEAARWLQIILGSLSCLLLFRLGSRFFGRAAGWMAWGMAALYGPLIYFDLQLLNASLGVFLLLLALERTTDPEAGRWSGPLLGGLCLGLAGITVATLLVTVPVLGVWLLLRGRRAWLWFLLACATPVLAVTAWNWAGSGEPVLISYNGGINFWIGNNPDYDSTVALRPGRDWKELVQRPVEAGVTRLGETSAWWYGETWRWIREAPGEWGSLLLEKAQLLLRGDEIYRNQEIYPFRQDSLVLRLLLWIHGIAFPFGWLLPLAGAGAVLLVRPRGHRSGAKTATAGDSQEGEEQQDRARAELDAKPEAAVAWRTRAGPAGLLLAMTAVLGLAVIAFFVTSRYRLPMVPILMLLAAGGAARLLGACPLPEDVRTGIPTRRILAAAAAFLVLLIVSNAAVPSMPGSFNSDTYSDWGTELFSRGELDVARLQYERALELDPGNAEAAHNLGGILLRQKRLDGAERCFRIVLDEHPGDLNALLNLGAVSFYRGDLYKAGRYYHQAVQAHPGSSEARGNLQGLQQELNRREAERLRRDPSALLDSLKQLRAARPDNEFLRQRMAALEDVLRDTNRD